MSKFVTVRRGERLPENMVGDSMTLSRRVRAEIKKGGIVPNDAEDTEYTVAVRDDPQAYLMVPCADKTGGHYLHDNTCLYVGYARECQSYQQIPCALTLEDLRWAWGQTGDASDRERRFKATIAAWSAVPQAKESNNV